MTDELRKRAALYGVVPISEADGLWLVYVAGGWKIVRIPRLA